MNANYYIPNRPKYDKLTIDQAATFCAQRASWWELWDNGDEYRDAEHAKPTNLDTTRAAFTLATKAYLAVASCTDDDNPWAEAEAMLRTGWLP